MWSVLLCVILGAYFAKRLMNKGKLKRACEFQEKFPKVLHSLRNFLKMKNNFSISGGSTKFTTLKCDSLGFGRDWTYESRKRLSFAFFCSVAFNEESIHIKAYDVALDCEFGKQVSASSGVC